MKWRKRRRARGQHQLREQQRRLVSRWMSRHGLEGFLGVRHEAEGSRAENRRDQSLAESVDQGIAGYKVASGGIPEGRLPARSEGHVGAAGVLPIDTGGRCFGNRRAGVAGVGSGGFAAARLEVS